MKSNLIQSIIAFIVKIGAGFLSYFLFIIAAKYLGSYEFGIFSVSFSIVMLLGILGGAGQQEFLIKNILKSQVHNSKDDELGVYFFSLTTTFIFSLLSGISFVIWKYFSDNDFTFTAILGGALLCFFYGISQTTIGALRTQEKTITAIFTRDFLWRMLTIIILYLCTNSFFIDQKITLTSSNTLLIMAISLLPIIFFHILLIFKHIKKRFGRVSFKLNTFNWLEQSSGFILIAFISSADSYIYTIMLGKFLPANEVGAFFASFKTIELLKIFLIVVSIIFAPQFAKLLANKNYQDLQRKCNCATLLQSTPILICAAILLMFAPICLSFFNPNFVEHANILRILTVITVVTTITGSKGLLMQYGDLYWKQVYYQGVSLLVAICLLPPLVINLGIVGAPIALFISKILWIVLALYSIRKNLHIDPTFLALFTKNPHGFKQLIKDISSQVSK